MAKESFEPGEPLPAFTMAALDEHQKQELLQKVQQAAYRPAGSVERAMAKESFAPDEPLPAFTMAALDEDRKQELLARVEASRADGTHPVADGLADPAARPDAEAVDDDTTTRSVAAAPEDPAARPVTTPPARGGAPRSTAPGAGATARLTDAWSAACAFVDDRRRELPENVRKPLRNVSAGVILGVAALLFVSIVVGTAWVVRSLRSPAAVAAAPSAAPPAADVPDPAPPELEQAKKQGRAALEQLATRRPKDARVWLALAAETSAKGDPAAAVNAVGKALAADPTTRDQPVAIEVLASAARKKATLPAAFTLLAGPMGAQGATIIYDLSFDPETPMTIRGQLETVARSEPFRRTATEDVVLAAGLRYGASCAARHDLLATAAEKGGRRALAFLLTARTPGGCGRDGRTDCFPCFRQDDALEKAIAAIQKRLSGN